MIRLFGNGIAGLSILSIVMNPWSLVLGIGCVVSGAATGLFLKLFNDEEQKESSHFINLKRLQENADIPHVAAFLALPEVQEKLDQGVEIINVQI